MGFAGYSSTNCRNSDHASWKFCVSRKQGASALDTAIQQLQHVYYITVDGNERKISAWTTSP